MSTSPESHISEFFLIMSIGVLIGINIFFAVQLAQYNSAKQNCENEQSPYCIQLMCAKEEEANLGINNPASAVRDKDGQCVRSR